MIDRNQDHKINQKRSCPLINEPDRSEQKDVENLVRLVERKTTKYQINSTQSKD